jgi:hypothetical protein
VPAVKLAGALGLTAGTGGCGCCCLVLLVEAAAFAASGVVIEWDRFGRVKRSTISSMAFTFAVALRELLAVCCCCCSGLEAPAGLPGTVLLLLLLRTVCFPLNDGAILAAALVVLVTLDMLPRRRVGDGAAVDVTVVAALGFGWDRGGCCCCFWEDIEDCLLLLLSPEAVVVVVRIGTTGSNICFSRSSTLEPTEILMNAVAGRVIVDATTR